MGCKGPGTQDHCCSIVQRREGGLHGRGFHRIQGLLKELRSTELTKCGERYDRRRVSPGKGHEGLVGPPLSTAQTGVAGVCCAPAMSSPDGEGGLLEAEVGGRTSPPVSNSPGAASDALLTLLLFAHAGSSPAVISKPHIPRVSDSLPAASCLSTPGCFHSHCKLTASKKELFKVSFLPVYCLCHSAHLGNYARIYSALLRYN